MVKIIDTHYGYTSDPGFCHRPGNTGSYIQTIYFVFSLMSGNRNHTVKSPVCSLKMY